MSDENKPKKFKMKKNTRKTYITSLQSIAAIFAACILLFTCDNLYPPDRTPPPAYKDNVFELSFSPDTSEAALVKLIEDCRETIYVSLYGFDNEAIADALIEAHEKRGIEIKMVTEYDSEHSESWQRMIEEGIPVVLGNVSGIMHNKYFIFCFFNFFHNCF